MGPLWWCQELTKGLNLKDIGNIKFQSSGPGGFKQEELTEILATTLVELHVMNIP